MLHMIKDLICKIENQMLVDTILVFLMFFIVMKVKRNFTITGLVEKIFDDKISTAKLKKMKKFKILINNKIIKFKNGKYLLTDKGITLLCKSYEENANILNFIIAFLGILISITSMSIALFSIIINIIQ